MDGPQYAVQMEVAQIPPALRRGLHFEVWGAYKRPCRSHRRQTEITRQRERPVHVVPRRQLHEEPVRRSRLKFREKARIVAQDDDSTSVTGERPAEVEALFAVEVGEKP